MWLIVPFAIVTNVLAGYFIWSWLLLNPGVGGGLSAIGAIVGSLISWLVDVRAFRICKPSLGFSAGQNNYWFGMNRPRDISLGICAGGVQAL